MANATRNKRAGKLPAFTIFLALLVLAPAFGAGNDGPGEDTSIYSKKCPERFRAPSERGYKPNTQGDIAPLAGTEAISVAGDVSRFRAVGALWSKNAVFATATLVGPEFVLTINHGIASLSYLSDHVFALDWQIAYSGTEPATLAKGHVRCFPLVLTDVVSSPPGHLDYTLIRIARDSEKKLPKDWHVSPLSTAKNTTMPRAAAPVYLVGAQEYASGKNYRPPEGMVLIRNAFIRRIQRWIKDAGGSTSVDYAAYSVPGLSGSPVFNSDHHWIAIHQRDLNIAKCDVASPWHPYLTEYYQDRFGAMDLASRVENQCGPGRTPPGDPLGDDEPRKYELPRQGTPIVEIVQDIVQRKSIGWACAHVPDLLSILPELPMYSCDASIRAASRRAEYYGSGGVQGGESAPAGSVGTNGSP